MQHYPIIVIGAGAGGLVVAIGAARANKKVVLIEQGLYGGDCTNFGCIPSKSLIASAEDAHSIREGRGLQFEGIVQPTEALKRVHRIVQEVRSHEGPAALHEKGVQTLTGTAHFLDPHTLKIQTESGEQVISGDKIVIATGSSPLVPPIQGINETPYLTNETVFDLKEIPKRLCVIGGGPIGCELTQAFCRLGSEVSQVHRRPALLKREEPEAQAVILKQFQLEGIQLYLEYHPKSVIFTDNVFTLSIESDKESKKIITDALLVAVGRRVNVDKLNLEAAKVRYSKKGIVVDKYKRTSQKHIWAIGDVTGGAQFTHVAEHHGRTVLASLVLPFKKKESRQAIPRTTFTDPEVASFGLLQSQAEEKYEKANVATYFVPMSENDRAITAGREEGFVKVVTKKTSSKILGATIVGPRAGEMLPELSLAAKEKIPLRKISNLIHPYPTYNLAIRRSADLWLTQVLLPRLKHPLKGTQWKRFLPLLIIVLFMAVAYFSGLQRYLTYDMLKEHHEQIKNFVMEHKILTPLVYMVIYAIITTLSIPGGAIFSIVGGFLFPLPWSTLYVLIGATVGASGIFLAARTAFGEVLRRKAGPFLNKMRKGFQQNAWSYLLFLRFVPLFPFWLVNIAPAIFNVSFLTYFWTTFVGIIPGAYVYTQTGAGLDAIFAEGAEFSIGTLFNVKLRIALLALALFALVPVFIKKWRARRAKSS